MSEELNVALIQAPLVWEDPERNRALFSQKIAEIKAGVHLIVLPEMFTTGFTMSPDNIALAESRRTVHWMQEEASKKNAAIVGSTVFQEAGAFFNRLFFVEPDQTVSYYDKRHTFTLAGEDKVYSAGSEKLIVNYRGFAICPMVCYDLRFPVWARNVENYDVLLYVANWPKPRINAWDNLLKARAIENMCYCIGVNRVGEDRSGHSYCGHSAVYDTLGEELVFSTEETMLYTTLRREHISTTRNQLKFLDDRDPFTLEG